MRTLGVIVFTVMLAALAWYPVYAPRRYGGIGKDHWGICPDDCEKCDKEWRQRRGSQH